MLRALSKIPLNPTGLNLQPKFCKEFSAAFWLQNFQFCKENLYEQSPPLICACSFLHLNSICFNPINLITHWWTCYQELASRFFVKWMEGYHKLEFLTHFCREGGKKIQGLFSQSARSLWLKWGKRNGPNFLQEPLSLMGTTSQQSARVTNYHRVRNLGTAKSCLCKPCLLYFWWVYRLSVGNV